MAQYDESGLRLFLKDKHHFRFQDLPAYNPLKGQRLKEIDFCWEHDDDQRIVMLELKEFTRSHATLTAADFTHAAYRFETLINKLTDSLMILSALWLDTAQGKLFLPDIPHFATKKKKFLIIVAIDLPPNMKSHYNAIRDKLNARMRGRLALFDIGSVAVLSYPQLLAQYPAFIKKIP